MVVCNDEGVARRVRLLRNQGMEVRYRNEVAGLNNRMTDVAAAIGRVQLRRLPGWNATDAPSRRRTSGRLARRADAARAPTRREPVWHQYTVRPPTGTRSQPAWTRGASTAPSTTRCRRTGCRPTTSTLDLPETERAAAEVLSLPIRPGLTEEEVDRVVAAVNEAAAVHG